MILIINTANNDFFELILAKNEDDFKIKKVKAQFRQAEKLLPAIDALVGRASLKKLKGLGVVSGPGGFTSLRIGIITANTLAFALKVPVVGIALDEFKTPEELVVKIFARLKKVKLGAPVLPEYGREPNITIKK